MPKATWLPDSVTKFTVMRLFRTRSCQTIVCVSLLLWL